MWRKERCEKSFKRKKEQKGRKKYLQNQNFTLSDSGCFTGVKHGRESRREKNVNL